MSAIQNNLQNVASTVSKFSSNSFAYLKNIGSQTYAKLPEISVLAKSYLSKLGQEISSLSAKSFSWIKIQSINLSSKIGSVAKTHLAPTLTKGSTFLFQYKAFILGGIVIGAALYAIYYLWKNRAQQPIVSMQTTLNVAKLSIIVPKEMHTVPDIAMAFCIDTSGSMDQEDRLRDVKIAMAKMLNNAQNAVINMKALIKVSAVEFNSVSNVVVEPTALHPLQKNSEKVMDKINEMAPKGNTEMLLGLDQTIQQLEEVAKKHPKSKRHLILLTDGLDTDITPYIDSIHRRLKAIGSDLYAIGIGHGHDKKTLRMLTQGKSFQGMYIDTTLGQDTIDSAISKIYAQAISVFHQIELTCPSLNAGTWSVMNTNGIAKDDQMKVDLGSLSEGETGEFKIAIHSMKLTEPLELSNVKFVLTFIDPKGRNGRKAIFWNPNTMIDPALLH